MAEIRPQIISPPTEPPVATTGGDPHYVGFNGERYDFHGAPGRWFIILSDTDIQITARIVAVPNDPIGTFHGQICLMVGRGNRIIITRALDRYGLVATLDGKRIKAEGLPLNTPGYHGDVYLDGQGVCINTGKYIVRVDRTSYAEQYPDADWSWHPFYGVPHLDLAVEKGPLWVQGRIHSPHGVLGQTANEGAQERLPISDGMQGEGVIEGTWTDYEVPGPWTTNFKYNRYHTRQAQVA